MAFDRNLLANRTSGDLLWPILAAAIGALDGIACPQNQMLARMTGLTVGQIDTALARGIGMGRLRRDMRHRRSRRLVVLDEGGEAVAATGYSMAGCKILSAETFERAKDAVRAAGGNPADDGGLPVTADAHPDDTPRVNNLRCPRCNLPPNHVDCRHGWNGATTRLERRAIAMEAAA